MVRLTLTCLRGGGGGEGPDEDSNPRRRGRENLYLTPHSPPEWLCIKMGGGVSPFTVLLIVKGEVTGSVMNPNFERKGEPKPS